MAELPSPSLEGVSRSTSDAPPNHHIVTIKSFSELTKNNIDTYTSNIFEAGGYKWKLVFHPNGNKNKGITDHISMYLAIVEGNSLPAGWEVRAVFRLFMLDQNKDNYLMLQDATAEQGRRFHRMKLDQGFDKFLSHSIFKDSTNGYLVNDTCVFGAEVYVCQEKHTIGKGESLTMIKDAISYQKNWKIENFSSLTEECVESKPFTAADQKWKLQLYTRGKGSGTGTHISLYLTLAEPETLPPGSKIYVEFTLRIMDQVNKNHYFGKADYWFTASSTTRGWPRFVSHVYFNSSISGLKVKDMCLVESELSVHGVANAL